MSAPLSEETIVAIISTSILVCSELLPFMNITEGNGVVHAVLLFASKLLLAMQEKESTGQVSIGEID
jgi:hypothetical protein